MPTLICILCFCLLAGPTGDASAASQDASSAIQRSLNDTLHLGIILVSSEILECSICGESIVRTIVGLNQLNDLDGVLAFIVPDHPLTTSENEYKIYAKQALGFSSKNELNLPFFMLSQNVFQRPATQSPLVLHALIGGAPVLSKRAGSLKLLNINPAVQARSWATALHSGRIQILLAFALFFYILISINKYRKIQSRMGKKYASWYPWFSLATREGRFHLLVWLLAAASLLFLLWTAFSIWLLTLLFLLVLFAAVNHAFSAVQAGENGINNALVFFPWEEIASWKVDNKRSALYLIHGDTPPLITSIGLPPPLRHPVQTLLNQYVPQKKT